MAGGITRYNKLSSNKEKPVVKRDKTQPHSHHSNLSLNYNNLKMLSIKSPEENFDYSNQSVVSSINPIDKLKTVKNICNVNQMNSLFSIKNALQVQNNNNNQSNYLFVINL